MHVFQAAICRMLHAWCIGKRRLQMDSCTWGRSWCRSAGEDGGYSPSEVRVFINRDDLDFGSAEDLPPTQKWDLSENLRGEIELPTQACLALHALVATCQRQVVPGSAVALL